DDSTAFNPKHFLAPRYWPLWIAFGLMWSLAQLPMRVRFWIGRRLGDTLGTLHRPRRAIAKKNIDLCFPEWTEQKRRRLLHQQFQSLGMSLIEMASLWFGDVEEIKRRTKIIGLENLQPHPGTPGNILLQAHFSTLEIVACVFSTAFPIYANYDKPKNLLYRSFLLHQRERFMPELISNNNIRRMARCLREGQTVWYSPDQFVKTNQGGVPTTFFSQPTNTTDATSRLARITGARVVPFLTLRTSKHGYWEARVSTPLDDFPGEEPAADTQRINDLLESVIREHPEQYFWVHKRFKRMDASQPDPYR
ncbi:MAG: lysophospholipid acyltransferase family protein, partial [Pseudomonadota bacterium]